MGMSIRIGNARIRPQDPMFPHYEMDIETEFLARDDNVPFTLGIWASNEIEPSYCDWISFCGEVGIFEAFFYIDRNGDPWAYGDPGAVFLSKDILDSFKEALETYQAKYPDVQIKDELTTDTVKTYLHYLNWLIYWSERALKNEDTPAIGIGVE